MLRLDRDRIWRTAWGAIPFALVANLFLGLSVERSTRLEQQAYAEAGGNHWERAAELYREAAEANPASVTAAYNAAAAYRKVGNLRLAVLYAEAALQIDPSHALARKARDEIRRAIAGQSRQRGAGSGVAQKAGEEALVR